MTLETANVIRRMHLEGRVTADQAVQANADLFNLTIEEWPYYAVAGTAWDLLDKLSFYDASYVAVAELIGATLVTLDRRIAGSPDLHCTIVTPARP